MGILGIKRTQERASMLSVDTATSMLARNIIFDPSIAAVVLPSISPLKDYLSRSDAGVFLRMLCERGIGGMNSGIVEEVIESHPSKVWSRSIRLRATGDSRGAIDAYLDVIRQSGMRDRLVAFNSEIGLALTNDAIPISEIQRRYLDGISKTTTVGGGVTKLSAHSKRAKEYIAQVISGNRPGCSTGLGKQMDEYHWYDPGCLTVTGGTPGSGKTSLIVSSMVAMANAGKRPLFFSIEMPGYQVALRTACIICNIPFWRVRRNHLLQGESDILFATLDNLENLGIYIDDQQNSIEDVYFKSASQEDKPDCIFVDYAELITMEDSDRSDLMIGNSYKRGKSIAKALDTHVNILSQIKRDVDDRPDKWPMMRDFSGTKMAEQAADYGALLMRPQYYFERGLKCRLIDPRDTMGVCYYILAKSRNDGVGVVTMGMDAELMRFYELQRDNTAMRLQESDDKEAANQ